MSEFKFEGCTTKTDDDALFIFRCNCGESFELEPGNLFGACFVCGKKFSWQEMVNAINAAVRREEE
jgi:hypothetical protein